MPGLGSHRSPCVRYRACVAVPPLSLACAGPRGGRHWDGVRRSLRHRSRHPPGGAARGSGKKTARPAQVHDSSTDRSKACRWVAERRPSIRSIPARFRTPMGTGVGDLKGILARLPHLVELGVDALWLVADLPPRRWRISATTSNTIPTSRPLFGSLRRLRRAGWAAAPPAQPESCCSTWCRTTPPTGIPGFLKQPPVRATIRSAIGTSGATRRRAAVPPNNWDVRIRRQRPWQLDEAARSSIITTRFSISRPDPQLAQPGGFAPRSTT